MQTRDLNDYIKRFFSAAALAESAATLGENMKVVVYVV